MNNADIIAKFYEIWYCLEEVDNMVARIEKDEKYAREVMTLRNTLYEVGKRIYAVEVALMAEETEQ